MPYAYEIEGLNGLGDINTLEDSDLTETGRILMGLYQLAKSNKNITLMKAIKQLFAKLRMEFGLRTKKVKSSERRKMIGDTSEAFALLKADAERWLAEKGITPSKLKGKKEEEGEEKAFSILEMAMYADTKTDPMILQKLGKFFHGEDRTPAKDDDETVIKGDQVGTRENPINILEVAMRTDLKTHPMALQKLGKKIMENEDE